VSGHPAKYRYYTTTARRSSEAHKSCAILQNADPQSTAIEQLSATNANRVLNKLQERHVAMLQYPELSRRTPASSSKSERAGYRQQGHAGSKTLHQQNPPVLNWRCRPTQADLYNGRKMGGWVDCITILNHTTVV